MDVKYINPFIEASIDVLKSFFNEEISIGKVGIKPIEFNKDTRVILIGMTGNVKGQIFLGFGHDIACEVVGTMMGKPVNELDEIGESALAELGNIIIGNTSTIFSKRGIKTDITPPAVATGSMKFDIKETPHVYIPILIGEREIEMHIALK